MWETLPVHVFYKFVLTASLISATYAMMASYRFKYWYEYDDENNCVPSYIMSPLYIAFKVKTVNTVSAELLSV